MENADPAHGDPDSEDTVTIEQKVITRLTKAIEADSTSEKPIIFGVHTSFFSLLNTSLTKGTQPPNPQRVPSCLSDR